MGFKRQYGKSHALNRLFLFMALSVNITVSFNANAEEVAATELIAEVSEKSEKSIANDIVELIKQDKKQQAFELASQQALQYEGLPIFDYAYGLAAQKVNQHHKAIFAFERVLGEYPNQLSARYALAISYFHAGNILAAEKEFDLVQSLDNKKQFIYIPQYLAQIEQRKQRPSGIWNHAVQAGIGIDSNANSGTEHESIGSFVIDDQSQKLSDQYLSTQWQTSFFKPINQKSSWYALGRIKYNSFLQNSEMSRFFADVIAGYKIDINDVKYHINAYVRPMWLDGEKYIDYNGVTADVSHSFKQGFDLGANINLAMLRFDNDLLDKNQQIISAWFGKKLSGVHHKVTVFFGNESSVNFGSVELGRNFTGLSYQTAYSFSANDRLSAKIDYISSSYDGVYFGKSRDDNLIKLNIDYQKLFGLNWSWLAKLTIMSNDSTNDPNHGVFSYDRAVLWNSAQYIF